MSSLPGNSKMICDTWVSKIFQSYDLERISLHGLFCSLNRNDLSVKISVNEYNTKSHRNLSLGVECGSVVAPREGMGREGGLEHNGLPEKIVPEHKVHSPT